jgi:hypothetical protein
MINTMQKCESEISQNHIASDSCYLGEEMLNVNTAILPIQIYSLISSLCKFTYLTIDIPHSVTEIFLKILSIFYPWCKDTDY